MTTSSPKITPADLEAKLREVAGEVDGQVERARPRIVTGGLAAVIVIVLLAYLFGRRGGSKRSAVVSIERL
jgi:hypothetical protein